MSYTRRIILLGEQPVASKATLAVYPYPKWKPEAGCLVSVILHGPEELELQSMRALAAQLSSGHGKKTLNVPPQRVQLDTLKVDPRDPRVDLARVTWVVDQKGTIRVLADWQDEVAEHLARLRVELDLAVAEETTA